ncbi:serine/threonine protein kinase [Acidianus sp. HS-5]|uniref:serine/threonine protein kinase n=1 Tax=Acidianus sp. HS-5 TaxID=2886040 RepID=UPI001F48301D|nr:serine/threonine protein kinase [Acidianus sp. HS-5]BDC19743.1 serine/threonine protein kinase [Acidianus sp. HS-5]
MLKSLPEENSKLVEIRNFIYPAYSKEVEKELKSAGICYAYSFGRVNLGKVSVIGKGKTGIVVYIGEGKVAKIRRTDSPKNSLDLEAKIQSVSYPSAPKVFDYGVNYIVMEYVNGRGLTRTDIKYLEDLLFRAKHLENIHVQHEEIARPWKNVLVTQSRTYIIDYDSASIKERSLNVTKILSAFGFYQLAEKYKRNEIGFEEIIDFIKK